jgi:carbamoyltransferase
MYILGLNIGHNATACLLKDGKIVNCVSEERFSRIKNHSGIPFSSIKYILEDNKISMNDICLVVLDDHYSITNIKDYGKHHLEWYTKKTFLRKNVFKIAYNYPSLFKKYHNLKSIFLRSSKNKIDETKKQSISKALKVPIQKIKIIDHHLAHAFSPCFNLNKEEKTLIFTLDGEGSGSCASLNIFDGKNLKVVSRSKKSASLGNLYAICTMFLGMKPLQHEFKVMGLAAYAKEKNIQKIYPKFQELVWLNKSLKFDSKFDMALSDYWFFKEMKFQRFDVIAGALQKLVEERTCEWVEKAIKKTGIKNIALSGGVFMNVKANMRIAQLPDVKNIFVMPSCGDEANAIGCCLYGYSLYCKEKNLEFNLTPIKDLYLGPEYNEEYIKQLIKKEGLEKEYIIKKEKNVNKKIAELLSKGEIVGRCTGRSEWGARALGNRSILADPSNPKVVQILNEAIKDRDFWMPFTPSILDNFEKKYIQNKKRIFAPYMAITFDSTETARKEIPAAMHSYDFTIRPQIVTKEYNKNYYELIEEFRKIKGIGGVLNTSFNLHGEPNILTPEDALHTLKNSSLKYLVVNNYLFKKRE